MRRIIGLALLSVFTLVGGTAAAAGLLVKKRATYYYNGSMTNPSQFFQSTYWDIVDENGGCGEATKAPCHLSATDKTDLQTQLDGYSLDVDALVDDAGERN